MAVKQERKMIVTDPDTGKLYEKIAKAMTKQPGQIGTVYIKDVARVMAHEYLINHPELQIKVNS